MRNAVAILLIIVLVPATLVFSLVSSLHFSVATPRFIKHELAKANVYSIAQERAVEQLAKLKLDPNIPVTGADLQKLANRVVTVAWLRANVESVIDHLGAWMNGPLAMTLTLPVTFQEPKIQLRRGLDALLEEKISQLPICPKNGQAEGLCRLPGMTAQQLKDRLQQTDLNFDAMINELPDTVDLANPVVTAAAGGNSSTFSLQSQIQPMLDGLSRSKTVYRQFLRMYLYVALTLAAVFLLYLAVVAKGWRRLVRWLGILFLSIGALPFAVAMASRLLLERYAIPRVQLDMRLPTEIQNALVMLIRDLRQAVFSPLLIGSAILLIAGIGAVIGQKFVRLSGGRKVAQ